MHSLNLNDGNLNDGGETKYSKMQEKVGQGAAIPRGDDKFAASII